MIKPGNYRSLAVVLLTLCVEAARADTVRDIEWQDLIPRGEGSVVAGIDKSPDPVITHESSLASLLVEQTKAGRGLSIIPELDGQPVRIPGYLVPLDFDKTAVAEFLLVPYFGACIHVPPPPPNQTVYVETNYRYRVRRLFEAVWVSGTLQTESFSSNLAEAGYTLRATSIEPYEASGELKLSDYLSRFLLVFAIVVLVLAFIRWRLLKAKR